MAEEKETTVNEEQSAVEKSAENSAIEEKILPHWRIELI